jgi:K+-sensing histidine kinase KdpD
VFPRRFKVKVRVYAFLILSSEVTPLTLNDLTFSDDVIHVEQKVQIDVSDQGIGIPPHEREKIFEAFRQVGRKNAGSGQGQGWRFARASLKHITNASGYRTARLGQQFHLRWALSDQFLARYW